MSHCEAAKAAPPAPWPVYGGPSRGAGGSLGMWNRPRGPLSISKSPPFFAETDGNSLRLFAPPDVLHANQGQSLSYPDRAVKSYLREDDPFTVHSFSGQ
eukprot:3032137-Prymnesium_polylepis.1